MNEYVWFEYVIVTRFVMWREGELLQMFSLHLGE